MRFQRISQERVFEGKVFNVRIDTLRSEHGRTFRMDVVEHPGSIAVVPVDESDNLWFVDQYRHPVEGTLLELPAGTLDEGETEQACAERETQEEIGMRPSHLERLGDFYLAPGYSSERMVVYLATGLVQAPLPRDADENLRIVKIPLNQVEVRLRSGEFQDAKTLAGLTLALNRLQS